ncbi:MAG TPA: hypothetical protein VIH61_10120 [Waddliaceae bacterium]
MSFEDNITNQVRILCEQMPIRDNIVCLLHYGSVKQKEDFNDQSDLDFHLVLKRIDMEVLKEIKNIFSFSNKIDLSFHSIDEIVYKDTVIFQNGNQGIYFIHVLCSSQTLVGENIYLKIVSKLKQEQVNISVVEKMRYYIWLLRRNYVFANDLKIYKKYFVRIIKDILILERIIDYKNIAELNNRQVVNLFLDKFQQELDTNEISLISNLISLEQIKQPEIEMYIIFFAKRVNEIIWKNL